MNIPNSVMEDAKAAGFYSEGSSILAEGRLASVYITEQLIKFAELTLARNVPEVSNPNDLVIVRRGDVEALKQEAIFGVFRRDAVEFDKLNALLSNALVVSGEFGISFMKYTEFGVVPDDYKNQAGGYRAGWNDCIASVKYTITTPQQPQSVADALEEAAKICVEISAEHSDPFQSMRCANAIRDLIKLNAPKEGE